MDLMSTHGPLQADDCKGPSSTADPDPSATSDPCPPAFFFGGSSWGCIYDAGVYAGLLERFGPEPLRRAQWGGVSSGALTALVCALEKPPQYARGLYDQMASLARAHGVFGKMSIYHDLVLHELLPDGGSEWACLAGRLHLGVTMPFAAFRLISSWRSNCELRDAMHASMHIPLYMTHRTVLPDGTAAIDGGCAQNVASIDGLPTCIISVAAPAAHVRPEPMPSLSALFALCYAPASPAACDAAVARGRLDVLRAVLAPTALRPLSPSLIHATPAALLPGPVLPRIALQRAICAVAWIMRRAEEPRDRAMAFAAVLATCTVRRAIRARM